MKASREALHSDTANKESAPCILDRDRFAYWIQADGRPCGVLCQLPRYQYLELRTINFGKRINASLGGVGFLRDGDTFAGGR